MRHELETSKSLSFNTKTTVPEWSLPHQCAVPLGFVVRSNFHAHHIWFQTTEVVKAEAVSTKLHHKKWHQIVYIHLFQTLNQNPSDDIFLSFQILYRFSHSLLKEITSLQIHIAVLSMCSVYVNTACYLLPSSLILGEGECLSESCCDG